MCILLLLLFTFLSLVLVHILFKGKVKTVGDMLPPVYLEVPSNSYK